MMSFGFLPGQWSQWTRLFRSSGGRSLVDNSPQAGHSYSYSGILLLRQNSLSILFVLLAFNTLAVATFQNSSFDSAQ